MGKTLCRVALLSVSVAVVGCSSGPATNTDLEGQRAPLSSSGTNTMNSPTTGPTGDGLSGGTESSEPPELDPNRGAKIP